MAATDTTIYVLLCGEDTYRVEVSLQGSLAMIHPAWNKRYTVVCTAVPGVDFADRRLRAVCHVIVLCPGCVTASDGAAGYANKPVIALDEAATSPCVRELAEASAECYYGTCSIAQLRGRLLSLALTPAHVLYDPLLECLTPISEAAFRRAFWLLDKTGVGLLHRSELLVWRRLVDPTTATERELRHLVAAAARCSMPSNSGVTADSNNGGDDKKGQGSVREKDQVSGNTVVSTSGNNMDGADGRGRDATVCPRPVDTVEVALPPSSSSSSATPNVPEYDETQLVMSYKAFVALHIDWLRAHRTAEAWATLYVMGTQPNGLPYSWYDLHSLRVEPDMNTYLSGPAVQFFRGVYKLHYMRNPTQLWAVTPGCPWRYIAGLGGHCSDIDYGDDKDDGRGSVALTLDKFIECWKYLALENRTVVVQYARYWGYKGDTGLLFLRRHNRAARAEDESPPDTLHVLVVGGEGAGKRSLVRCLTGTADEAQSTAVTAATDNVCSNHISGSKNSCNVGCRVAEPPTIGEIASCDNSATRIKTNDKKGEFNAITPSSSPSVIGTASDFYVCTTTFFVRRGDTEEPQTLLYTVIPAAHAKTVLANENLHRSVDIVLLCLDASSEGLQSSAVCAHELCQAVFSGTDNAARREVGCSTVSISHATPAKSVPPCLVVLTKTDLIAGEANGDETNHKSSRAAFDTRLAREARPLAEFCQKHRLLWPPVRTSAVGPSSVNETAMLNTYVYEVVRNPELAIAAPALTPVRILRRLTLIAIVIVTTVAVAQSMTRRLRRRRVRTSNSRNNI